MKRILITLFVACAIAAGAITISQAASTRAPTAKRASSTTVGLPASTGENLTKPGSMVSGYELEPTRASYVEFGAARYGWVVPGRKGICLLVATSGWGLNGGCGSLANAAAGKDVTVERLSSGPVIYGYVPAGSSVTITNADGSNANAPVSNNVFMYTSPTARSVTVHLQGGGVTTTPISP